MSHKSIYTLSLAGSPYNPDTGLLDMERVRENLDLATSVYIDGVNHNPCGETVIHLFKGADSSSLQQQRKHLLVYLKGSRKKKLELKNEPQLYSYFNRIANIRQRHEIKDLPSQYIFLLVCCFERDCEHPLCQKGKEHIAMEWYPQGLSLDKLPLPVPDPKKPWSSTSCSTCSGFFAGHYFQKQIFLN